jgi:hypothetical protein
MIRHSLQLFCLDGLRPFLIILMNHVVPEDGFCLKIDAQTTFEALCFITKLDPGQSTKNRKIMSVINKIVSNSNKILNYKINCEGFIFKMKLLKNMVN